MEERFWHTSYPPSVKRSIDYQKVTIPEALTRSAAKFPHKVALNFMGKKITFLEFDGLVNRFARALVALGVKEGDRVALLLPNIPQTFITNLAIMRIGAVAVQNNPLYTERELEHQFNNSDAKTAVTLTLLLPRVLAVMPRTKIEKIIVCHIHSYLPFPKKQLFPFVKRGMCKKVEATDKILIFEDLIKKYSDGPVEDRSKWDELAAIIYTGGTTGASKGVMLSHKNNSVSVQQFEEWFTGMKSGEESMVGTYPLFHSAGFSTSMNLMIWKAWENLIMIRPEPRAIIELLKKHKPKFLPGIPTIFVGLLSNPEFRKLDLSYIRAFISGGAPLPEDIIRELRDLTGATILEIYGSTETAPLIAANPFEGKIKPGTVGLPAPDTDIRIVDTETGRKECKIGEAGEIVVKGPQVMMGYSKNEEETKRVLKGGWYYTGDIGFFDEDGYLTLVDRKKDLIIASGYNISPVEIDNILFDHPKIREACTVGVPDRYRGETVKAFIVVKEGETLTEEEVVNYCKGNLAAYKVPKLIEFMDELPKSVVGKVLRRELRKIELERREKKGK
jgi:long-chain acyl-CoA synthetase